MTGTLGDDALVVEYPQGQGPNLGDSRLSTSVSSEFLSDDFRRVVISFEAYWPRYWDIFLILIMHSLVSETEKAMAPHCSTLAWEILWTEEPGRLQSMGSRRVEQDWATSFSLFTFMHWRRKWQPTPVFLPGESQGQRSLVGCCLWGRTELDTTEVT